MSKQTGIALYEGDQYEVLNTDLKDLPAIFEANLGGGEISEFDLDRVGIPAGGGLSWTVPDLNGEPDSVKELVGVVILHGNKRVYWSGSFDEAGGGPPDCFSSDGTTGFGRLPSIDGEDAPAEKRACSSCPMAQWGSLNPSDPQDNRQACSSRKMVYLIRPSDMLPLVLDLAPTSVRAFNRFMLRLTSKGVPSYAAVVRLGLQQESGPPKYSVIKPSLDSMLSKEQADGMKAVAESLRPYFLRTKVAP